VLGEEFPRPVARISTRSPLRDWSQVAPWLARRGQLDPEVAAEAKVVREVNAVIEGERVGEKV
jgi:hypothetical protein